jgi:D-3-phosphoglycerate dehydrogenase
MKVLGFDPFLSRERMVELGLEPAESLDDMLPRIDYLTVHTPLTEETRGLIGAKEIERMKRGARLINAARGGIFDEDALVEALKSGRLAGVALDVYSTEPCTTSPLFGMPGVVCTPHLGASTEEAQTQVATEAVELLVAYLTTGAIRHAVNVASLDPKTLMSLRGYLDVAYRLGVLLAGMEPGGIKSCRVLYRGEIAEKETKVLTAVFAAGLLQRAMDEEVNFVNSELLLKQRGVELAEESRTDMGSFRASMTAEVTTDAAQHKATGTIFGQHMPRLVALDNYRLEAFLDGYLLVFRHLDVPGIIGGVGTIFGRHGVNIAQMAVGRAGESPGGDAVGILNLDGEPSAEALEEVRKLPSITSVTVVRLPAAGELPGWLQSHGAD